MLGFPTLDGRYQIPVKVDGENVWLIISKSKYFKLMEAIKEMK